MKLFVGGDYCIPSQWAGTDVRLDPRLTTIMSRADHRLLNLESPICGASTPIFKTGSSIRGKVSTIALAKSLGVDVFTLANNHIMDYGAVALDETLLHCADWGIATVGAGRTSIDAGAALVLDREGESLAVLNFAENEWASADDYRGGANPYDVVKCARAIRVAAARHDYVLAVLHGGHEYYPLPSRRMLEEFRFMAECGASAIVTHHSHMVSGYEVHHGVPIFYGLGNFLFLLPSVHASWYRGLSLSLEFNKRVATRCELHFTQFDSTSGALELLSGEARDEAMREVTRLSQIILEPRALEDEWGRFVKLKSPEFLWALHPLNRPKTRFVFRALRRLGFARSRLPRSAAGELLNRLRCESHRDIFQAVLDDCIR